MLPRVVPEPQYPGYDQNGQPRVRYTTTWATRALGTVPQGSYPSSIESSKHWEPKNTYENMCWALFLALFELCCAVAFTCLAVYHWAEAKTDSGKYWAPNEANQLLMTGLAASVVATFAVVAFYPDKRGRITKRLMVIFSIPTMIGLLESIQAVSSKISVQTNKGVAVNGFYIAEVILASVTLLLVAVTLFPASEGCAPFERQTSAPLRAITLSLNTVLGAVVLIYFCFSIYGVHSAFDPPVPPFVPVQTKLALATFAVPITSLLLIGIVGGFVAISRGIRPHIIPSLVVGIVCIAMFLELTPQYVLWINGGPTYQHAGDWRDDADVGMFALNFITLVGLVVQVSLGVAFLFY